MIKILIADDHAIVRAGFRQFISDESDMEVAAEAETGRQVLAFVHAHEFDVVLLDISMPDQNGIDTLQRLKRVKPHLPVLILSAFAESQYAINLMRAGASGYLNKESAPEELIKAIRTVTRGRKYVSPAFAQIMVDELSEPGEHVLHRALSKREFQVFCKLAAGNNVSKIAEGLNLSVKTVSTYRSRVLEKMNMQSNAELTAYAIRNSIID